MNKKDLRVIFMGTPFFALPPLQALCDAGIKPLAVYTQPDKINGRGKKVTFSPVKSYALEQNIPVYQPFTFKEEAEEVRLKELAPDLIVVIAYGRILPQNILDIPTYGAINIHASLLPKYRGAAPVQRAIIDEAAETGVSLMHLDAGMDTGPVISMVRLPLSDTVTAGELLEILAKAGAKELIQILDNLPEALAQAHPQDETKATYAEKLSKEMGRMDWTKPAHTLCALARGMYPNPGTYTFFRGKRVKIHHTVLGKGKASDALPGTIVSLDGGILWIATGDGILGISELQPENKKRMKASDFINGHQVHVHDSFDN